MKKIYLTNSDEVVLVDDADYDNMSLYRWWRNGYGYAVSTHYGRSVRMHRLLMEPPEGMVVDHINGDKLDNRRENLRVCTVQQNQYNKGIQKNNTTGYKGVHKVKATGKFFFSIKLPGANGKPFRKGGFKTALEAYEGYRQKAREVHGEFIHHSIK